MMQVDRPLEITVALVLADPADPPLDSVAWHAVKEAVSLFEVADGWIDVRMPGADVIRVAPHIRVCYLGTTPVGDEPSAAPTDVVRSLLEKSVWTNPGEMSPRPVGQPVMDQYALVAFTRELTQTSSGTVIVVHDRPIHPPDHWRYIIWDYVPGGVAVSFAPMDPLYWGDQVEEDKRLATVGHRLRAALSSVLGAAIGLHRCGNPTCFLYATVDRVSRLDLMVRIGEEHDAQALAGRGFAPVAARPDLPAAVVRIDEPEF